LDDFAAEEARGISTVLKSVIVESVEHTGNEELKSGFGAGQQTRYLVDLRTIQGEFWKDQCVHGLRLALGSINEREQQLFDVIGRGSAAILRKPALSHAKEQVVPVDAVCRCREIACVDPIWKRNEQYIQVG